MNRNILFIGEASSFIVNAINSGLKEAGFECTFCKPTVSAVSKTEELPAILFIYVDETVREATDTLVYIRDLCVENERSLFLIGYPDDVRPVVDMMPSEVLKGTFERPINVKAIAQTLTKLSESNALEIHKKHILVVDDSGQMLRTIKGWLEGKYRVSMVNSAVNAITFLSTNTPDLILLDYEMPVCSGPQMLGMIRAEVTTESIPVIFLTSKGDRESVSRVLSLKPQGYLLKTMPPEDIIASIDGFFAKQKAKEIKGEE